MTCFFLGFKAFFNRFQEGANTVSTRSSLCPTPCLRQQERSRNSQTWNKTMPQQSSISKRQQSTGTPRIRTNRSSWLCQPESNGRFWAVHLLCPSILSFICTIPFFLFFSEHLKEPKISNSLFIFRTLISPHHSSWPNNLSFPNFWNCWYLLDSSSFFCSAVVFLLSCATGNLAASSNSCAASGVLTSV